MKRFAIVLSGCGVFDGSEIHEAVLTMLAVRRLGADYRIFAPDVDQMHVVNHLTGTATSETRNVLVESARIARGEISPLSEFRPENFDAIVMPGGFGAAKNLSNYALATVNLEVNPDVEKAVCSMVDAGKAIGALCIAPVILAKLIPGVKLTLGEPCDDSEAAEKMGRCTCRRRRPGSSWTRSARSSPGRATCTPQISFRSPSVPRTSCGQCSWRCNRHRRPALGASHHIAEFRSASRRNAA